MKTSRMLAVGALAVGVGVALIMFAAANLVGRTQSVEAGNGPVCTNNPQPSPTPDPTASGIIALGGSQLPTCTPTLVIRRTRTPSPEPTDEPTQTEEPAPTNTSAPAPTNTPFGGSGAGVRGPDTGTGPADAGFSELTLALAGGIVLVTAGGLSVLTGFRRRVR